MYTLFVILIVITAIFMIAIVLIQESKGGGLSSNFASSNQIMGVRKTTDFIEKATWTLAAIMVIISIRCAYVAPHQTDAQSAIEKSAIENPLANPKTQQNFGATPAATEQQKDANAKDAAQPTNNAAPAKEQGEQKK